MTYLSCENIHIKYSYEPIVAKMSLKLNSGEKIALVGPNGCGKTSLLRVLAGLTKPDTGKVFCMDEEIWPKQQCSKEHFCLFLSSQPALLFDHSVLWNLEYYCQCYGVKVNLIEYKESLKKVGLLDKINLSAQFLSTGQKRRLTFAALILIQPNIILADEPTNGLDTQGVQLCLEILHDICEKKKSALLIATHDNNLIQWCGQKINLEDYGPIKTNNKFKITTLL